MKEKSRGKILVLTQFSLLLAIEAIVCFTPLGSLPIGVLVATLAHIPVIICALTLGTWAGTLMGFFAGLFSFIVWSFMPPSPILAFAFTPFYTPGNVWSLVICFVPRILIGTFSGLCFTGLRKLLHGKANIVSYIVSGIVGSLTNTVLVLGGIYLFFGEAYAIVNGLTYDLLLGAMMTVVATNGVLELIVGGVCAYAICAPINQYLKAKELK